MFKVLTKSESKKADEKLSKGIREFCAHCDYSDNYYKAMGKRK